MARKRKRLPPRIKSGPRKGQFRKRKSGGGRKRKRARRNPGRTVARRKRNPPARRRRRSAGTRRRRYRRNPSLMRGGIMGSLWGGAVEATQVLVGKAATRSVVDLTGLPKQGNAGLAVQVGVALGLGYVAEMFMSKEGARAILAGGLTAPIETMIVAYDVPWLANALSPTTQNANLGAYVMGAGIQPNRNSLSAYVRRAPRAVGAGADRGLSAYASSTPRRGLRARRGA